MDSRPQNPEFRDNPENFHHALCPSGTKLELSDRKRINQI